MFRVCFGKDVSEFATLTEAKSFAEKESWMRDQEAAIKCPDGKTVSVQIRNTL